MQPEAGDYTRRARRFRHRLERNTLGKKLVATVNGTPKMHQTAKGQQWSCGMMTHVAVDQGSKRVHTARVAAADVLDRDTLPYLLHGRERRPRQRHVQGACAFPDPRHAGAGA